MFNSQVHFCQAHPDITILVDKLSNFIFSVENRVTSTAVPQSRADFKDVPAANVAANSHVDAIFQQSYTNIYSKVKADPPLIVEFQGLDTHEDKLICETRDIQGKFNVLFTLLHELLTTQ